jgi:hypothetical protein
MSTSAPTEKREKSYSIDAAAAEIHAFVFEHRKDSANPSVMDYMQPDTLTMIARKCQEAAVHGEVKDLLRKIQAGFPVEADDMHHIAVQEFQLTVIEKLAEAQPVLHAANGVDISREQVGKKVAEFVPNGRYTDNFA